MRMDRVEFEENKWDSLVAEFIETNQNLWNTFIDKKYQEYEETAIDYAGNTEDDLYDLEGER